MGNNIKQRCTVSIPVHLNFIINVNELEDENAVEQHIQIIEKEMRETLNNAAVMILENIEFLEEQGLIHPRVELGRAELTTSEIISC